MRRTQAAYYILTGLWPIFAMRSFELITGEKREDWLVKTVGALAAVIGLALAVDTRRSGRTPAADVLAIGSGAAFALVDLRYVGTGQLRPIYLADAALETIFAARAARDLLRSRRVPTSAPG